MASAPTARGPSRVRLTVLKLIARFQPDETAIMVVMAVIVGLIGGFGAILFRWMVQFFQGFAIGRGENVVELLAVVPWWKKILLPVIGGAIVGPMVHFGAREARGHGVPEVLNSIVFRKGVIRPVVAAVKITASAITIGFGGSVGREGPIVQIGAAMGSSIGQWLRFSPQRLRTLIGCGAAAGIAATFNAPIAGAFFALEILLRDFAVATFSPIIVAAVTATAVSREFLGAQPAFPTPAFVLGGPQELPLFLVMGLLVGLLAVAYVRTLYAAEDAFESLPLPLWAQPALGGLLLGVLLIWFPQVYGVGYGTMVQALDGHLAWWLMLLLVAVKLLAVDITLGSGFSGGIFAPALFLGGMLGGGFGAVTGMIMPGSHDPVGAFAMVGMAAMVGAATGGPLTAILILFEMTGEYRVILPLMLASIGAALVYRSLMRDSIFTLKFARRGQELSFGRDSAILRQYQVQDIMEVNPVTIAKDAGLDDVLKLFLSNSVEHFYVVDHEGRLQGRISIHDVKEILHEQNLAQVVIADDLCSPQEDVVYRLDHLEDCLLALGHRDTTDLPVLYSREHPVLVGVVTRQSILEVYNREVLQHQDRGIHMVTGEARMHDCVELPEQYKVQLLSPPDSWYGRSLRELELRPRYGISVLAVKPYALLGGAVNRIPDPDKALEPGDRLIIVGEVHDLEKLLIDTNPRAFPGPAAT
ncbi:MAG TPA: chloride channel protein [Candidatus Krumholzibacteria bacterium]|nr:chloride channel protein [Candidatus Krumholzibacteria bacterium]